MIKKKTLLIDCILVSKFLYFFLCSFLHYSFETNKCNGTVVATTLKEKTGRKKKRRKKKRTHRVALTELHTRTLIKYIHVLPSTASVVTFYLGF